MYPKCHRCGGVLYSNSDGYADYYTCSACSREFNMDMSSRRMTTDEFKKRLGISADVLHNPGKRKEVLIVSEEWVNI